MSTPLVSDALWTTIDPLLPPEPAKAGRPRVPDRAAVTGMIFVLRSGIPWELPPQDRGDGSGVTCWCRLRDGQEVDVWDGMHQSLLDQLGKTDRIDWRRACLSSASIPAKKGARRSARSPPTAANRAPNGMSSRIGGASRERRR